MKVQMLALDAVQPYPGNPRRNLGAVDKVAASLSEFGWRQPIVVDEAMVVIAGHTRLLAARQLGMDKIPVHVAVGLSAEKVRAYRLADNRSGEEAEWDHDLLRIELAAIEEAGLSLPAATGFSADELAGFRIPDEAEAKPDAKSEPGAGAYKEQYGVIIICRDEAEQAAMYNRLLAEGRTVKVVTT